MRRAAAALVIAFSGLLAPRLQAADFRIDSQHSQARFAVRLLWLKRIEGHFERIDGEITLNARRDEAQVQATIDVNSVAMGSDRFRHWVLASEFFDAKHYPTIHFQSQRVSVAMLEHGGELAGTLTLRGVSRPVQFDVEHADCRLEQTDCRIILNGSVARSDFGMNGHSTALSDRVDLQLEIALHPALAP